ncbi:MAG: FAD-dependent oxidoreductase [Pseudomonadota bacterium]
MPDPMEHARVAVVGAGMAGASAARTLRKGGVKAALFDKSRGPGGRLATRRVTLSGRTITFDHGAQWAHARGAEFSGFLAEAVDAGHAAPWAAAPATNGLVGVPGMNAVVRFALADADLTTQFTANGLTRGGDGWHLTSAEGETAGPFEAVILTVPAPQLGAILGDHEPAFAQAASRAEYDPCWTLMLAFHDALAQRLGNIEDDALSPQGLEWVAFNGGKPGRDGATLVVHASGDFSRYSLELEKETAAERLSEMVCSALDLPAPVYAAAHRWRYSRVVTAAHLQAPFNPETMLGIAGDWCRGASVEDAFQSGLVCAEEALKALAQPS